MSMNHAHALLAGLARIIADGVEAVVRGHAHAAVVPSGGVTSRSPE
jgi:hypothetical protein